MTTLTTGPSGETRAPRRARPAPAGLRSAHSRGRVCHTRAAGFTLLELILVMVIICTVLAMASPSLRGFFASRATHDAAAQMVALAQFARAQAAAEGRVYRLNLDSENGQYWLTRQEQGAFAPLPSEFGRVFSLPEGTSASWDTSTGADAPDRVSFYPDGRAEAARIHLTGRQGEALDVVCGSPAELFRVVAPDAGEAL